MRILSVSNQKGGVGKTTTSINLAASLASAERKTLLIDMDPQANAGSGLGLARNSAEFSIYDVLSEERPLSDVILPTELAYLQLVPASQDLVGAEIELVTAPRREYRLRAALEQLDRSYDYVILDCPPSLGLLTLNALTACDSVVVPLQCEYFALEGLSALLNTIDLVRGGPNPRIQLEGIVLTMFDRRTTLSAQVMKEVRSHFGDKVFESVIPRNVRLSEAPSFGKPILLYDLESPGAQGYLALARELLGREADPAAPQAA